MVEMRSLAKFLLRAATNLYVADDKIDLQPTPDSECFRISETFVLLHEGVPLS